MTKRPGRLSGQAARRKQPWRRARNQAMAAVLAVALVGAGGLAIALDDDAGSAPATGDEGVSAGDTWRTETLRTFAPMSNTLVSYLQTMIDWSENDARASEMKVAAAVALPNFVMVRDALAKREPFAPAPRALDNARDSVALYIETARMATAAADMASAKSSGDLAEQARLAINRVRLLADRVFDQYVAELKPHTRQHPSEANVVLTKPAEVPNFAQGGQAPGSPLTEPRSTPPPRRYQESRPEQDFDGWTGDVRDADVPSATEAAEAIEDGDADALGELAERFTAASETLYDAPDPTGERLLSTRVQLGLLVQSEAMRAAQVAALAPAAQQDEFTTVAQTLAAIGNGMWDGRLGVRDGDFPADLRTRTGV